MSCWRRSVVFAGVGILALLAPAAQAIVLHTGDTGVAAGSRPTDNVIGAWGTNGSAVAIAPNALLTVRHTAGGVGTSVLFGGNPYLVSKETDIGTADLRVCQITKPDGSPANLTDIAPLYTDTLEVGQTAVIGGFGQGNGGPVSDATGQGYVWDGSANTTLRWGDNRITAGMPAVAVGGFTNDVLLDTFDPQNSVTATAHEGAIALYDSGGGWFINNNGVWQLAAITQAAEHTGDSYYALTGQGRGDENQAIRVSSYAAAISAAVPEPGMGGIMLIAAGGLLARRRGSVVR
jgi:hypothetical protein